MGWINKCIFQVTESGTVYVNGTTVHSSDRELKENFKDVDPYSILTALERMPIQKWNYKDNPEKHIGPMAQDFHKAFQIGLDDRTIASVDADGIALAAIQALIKEIKSCKEKIEKLEQKLQDLR